jgi:hypothetical protein
MKKRPEKKEGRIYLLAGIFFILMQINVLLRNNGDYKNLFWFCNFASILFAIAFFARKTQWIKAIISVSIIPQIFFLIDFLSSLFFKVGIFGQVQPYFQENILFILTTVGLHLTGFLAIALTYKTKPNKKTLPSAMGIILLTYLTTILFSPSNWYYNYIYGTRPGYISSPIPFKIITILWPIITFIVLVLPGHYLQLALYKLSRKNKAA